MEIKEKEKYRVKGNSNYFKRKYGTSNPVIKIQGEHQEQLGEWWGYRVGNPGCILYAMRVLSENLPMDSPSTSEVFYGKIQGLGELVHISELEKI